MEQGDRQVRFSHTNPAMKLDTTSGLSRPGPGEDLGEEQGDPTVGQPAPVPSREARYDS